MSGAVDKFELLRLMVDGAEQVCDYAETQWRSNKYRMSAEQCETFLAEWHQKRSAIRPFATEIRQWMRGQA